MNRYLDSHLDNKIAIAPKSSRVRILTLFLFAHILLVSFQLPFRAILMDITYIRDVLIVASLCLLLGAIAISGRLSFSKNHSLLDILVFFYLLYGMIMILIWLISGISPIESFREFRNNFFPVVLFFIAKKTLASPSLRIKVANIFFLIAMIYLIGVLIEYLLIKIIGYSPYIFPWYRYTFLFSYRYIGNVVSASGYIVPESTPVLGMLGWPHATAATLMVLFAFSYPYLLKRIRKNNYVGSSFWISRFPMLFRYFIVFLTATAIFLILEVKTQMVAFVLLILVLPFFTKGKNLGKNLLIATFLFIIALSSDFIQSVITKSFVKGFITVGGGRDSTIAYILRVNPFSAIANQPMYSILFGNWHEGGDSELRLLNYTLRFGLIWLLLFLGIFVVGFFYARKIASNRFVKPSDRLFAIGSIGLLFVCFLDMGHYARAMTWPIIDIMAVCLGALAAIDSDLRRKRLPTVVKEENCAQ